MPILNYTTQVPARKTAFEIQELLARAKASAVLMDFDEFGVLMAISFKLRTAHGLMAFRLPANVERVQRVLTQQKVKPAFRTKAHAANVGWRIIKVWLEAQLALVQSELVEVEQVFLPYAQGPTGATLYETMAAQSFDTLALTDAPK